MISLTREERIALRRLFDQDQNEVFQRFMDKVKDTISRYPNVGLTEWDTIRLTIANDAQYRLVDEILTVLNDNIANMGVEKDE